MRTLENRIPPPIVALLTAAGMWSSAPHLPMLVLPHSLRLGATAAIAVLGLALAIAGSASFRKARTTVNPLKPEAATALVASGVYRMTRNPMYLGMALGLLCLSVWLASPWTLLGPILFVAYMNRFQIGPEEVALEHKFGESYRLYKSRVRRWL